MPTYVCMYGIIKIIIHNRYITVIIFGKNPSYDKIYENINFLFVLSAVCRKSLLNRNNFRSFYKKVVKNALKTSKNFL